MHEDKKKMKCDKGKLSFFIPLHSDFGDVQERAHYEDQTDKNFIQK